MWLPLSVITHLHHKSLQVKYSRKLDKHLLKVKNSTEGKVHIKFDEVPKVIFKTSHFDKLVGDNPNIKIIEKMYNVNVLISKGRKYIIIEPDLSRFHGSNE